MPKNPLYYNIPAFPTGEIDNISFSNTDERLESNRSGTSNNIIFTL